MSQHIHNLMGESMKGLRDLVDVDWNATISSYIMQQTALQASYKAFTDMQGLSLFQLNK